MIITPELSSKVRDYQSPMKPEWTFKIKILGVAEHPTFSILYSQKRELISAKNRIDKGEITFDDVNGFDDVDSLAEEIANINIKIYEFCIKDIEGVKEGESIGTLLFYDVLGKCETFNLIGEEEVKK